jgi:hypothetical protein
MLAWTRTAIGFAAVGAAILKASVPAGLAVLAMSVPIWVVDRLTRRSVDTWLSARRHVLVTTTVIVVALAALAVAFAVPSENGLVRPRPAGSRPAGAGQDDAPTSSRAAAAMWLAVMPAAASSSLLVPEPGISRTARCATDSSARPAPVSASSTAEPRPPSG